jgi:hypothetical protein
MFRCVAESVVESLCEAGQGASAAGAIGPTLRAISSASNIAAAADRAGIMADFARRIAAARASADPQQLAGILRTIKEQRRAALAIASRNAQRESHEKRQAVLQGGASRRPGPAAPKNYAAAKRPLRNPPIMAPETLDPDEAYLFEPLDWLNLWQSNAPSQSQSGFGPSSSPLVPRL